MKIELTLDEANTLVNLLDLAVKAGGLTVAARAMPFVVKLEQAVKSEQPETVEAE